MMPHYWRGQLPKNIDIRLPYLGVRQTLTNGIF
jgi:hypothetical protein